MNKIFTNTSAIIILFGQIGYTTIILIFVVSIFWRILVHPLIEANLLIWLLLLSSAVWPIYFLICTILSYRCEKGVQFIVDNKYIYVKYKDGGMSERFVLSDVREWYFVNNPFTILSIYELHLTSGVIIRYSNMVPLTDFLVQHKEYLGLPDISPWGASFQKAYMKEIVTYNS